MEPFFAAYQAVSPWLIPGGRETSSERQQSPAEVKRFAGTATCNQCAACTSACPVYWNDREYVGPADDRRRAPVHLRQPGRGRPTSGWRS